MYLVIIIYACLSIPNLLRSMSCFDEKAEYKIIRDGPFNLKGGGGLWFFLKNYSDSQCC